MLASLSISHTSSQNFSQCIPASTSDRVDRVSSLDADFLFSSTVATRLGEWNKTIYYIPLERVADEQREREGCFSPAEPAIRAAVSAVHWGSLGNGNAITLQ